MKVSNKIAFTQDQKDYVDYLVNGKNLDQKTVLSFIAHKYEIKGLDAYALYLTAIKGQ